MINSQETKTEIPLYRDSYEIDRNEKSKLINDNFIIDEVTAEKRAIAEFLEFG